MSTQQQSIQELLEKFEKDAQALYKIHQKYAGEWGIHHMEGERFHLVPVTYREQCERDWQEVQDTIKRLRDYPSSRILRRNDLDTFISTIQGMSIRVVWLQNEEKDVLEDRQAALRYWNSLKQTYKELYQFSH